MLKAQREHNCNTFDRTNTAKHGSHDCDKSAHYFRLFSNNCEFISRYSDFFSIAKYKLELCDLLNIKLKSSF